jgi:hypothetical protein
MVQTDSPPSLIEDAVDLDLHWRWHLQYRRAAGADYCFECLAPVAELAVAADAAFVRADWPLALRISY